MGQRQDQKFIYRYIYTINNINHGLFIPYCDLCQYLTNTSSRSVFWPGKDDITKTVSDNYRDLFFSKILQNIACSSSIYGFWLPLWYLQTLLTGVTGNVTLCVNCRVRVAQLLFFCVVFYLSLFFCLSFSFQPLLCLSFLDLRLLITPLVS